jgi:hypothetical protein
MRAVSVFIRRLFSVACREVSLQEPLAQVVGYKEIADPRFLPPEGFP